jgi:hypothetical protein
MQTLFWAEGALDIGGDSSLDYRGVFLTHLPVKNPAETVGTGEGDPFGKHAIASGQPTEVVLRLGGEI